MNRSLFAHPAFPVLFAAFFCLALYLTGIYCRPIFPVDETRYMTVAWEMVSRPDFILPHLNGEPYDHKPPLLFWSINLLWALFGVGSRPAMAVPFLYAFAFILLTYRLAKKIKPDDSTFPLLAVAILTGSLPFIIYSNMIMFDLMLGVCSMLGLTAIWDYTKTGNAKHLAIFAIAVGLGALAKGPAILLHTLFPVVFVRYWNKDGAPISRKKWVSGFILAILAGTLIGLAWAIPAALKGGPVYANKIFWGQTAGRVSNAFDHKHPVWWYLPFVPLFLMPWIFSPLVWRGIKFVKDTTPQTATRFLAIWVIPVFLSFSLISGKQIHYLVPLLPGIAIFVALCMNKASGVYKAQTAIAPFIFLGVCILLPLISKILGPHFSISPSSPLSPAMIGNVSPAIPALLFAIAAIITFIASRKSMLAQVLALSVSSLMLMMSFQLSAKDGLFKTYDLAPVAEVIQKNPNAPLAFTRNYHGEWGYLARLDNRTVKELQVSDLHQWFKENPKGMAFLRTGHPEELQPYDVLYTMPYKTDNTYAIVVKRGQAAHFAVK